MASFVFAQYQGDDAGAVLARLFGGDERDLPPEVVEAMAANERAAEPSRVMGFAIPETDVEEPDEPDTD